MQTKENVLSPQVFSYLRYAVEDFSFPWYYTSTAYEHAYFKDGYSLVHTVYENNQKISPYADILEFAVLSALDSTDQKIDKLLRIRIGCIPFSEKRVVHYPHTDYSFDHMTGIIYLNDTDGETIFYQERFDPSVCESSKDYFFEHLKGVVNIEQTSHCTENKMVWFNGNQYHSSSTPSNTFRRIAINFNYTTI